MLALSLVRSHIYKIDRDVCPCIYKIQVTRDLLLSNVDYAHNSWRPTWSRAITGHAERGRWARVRYGGRGRGVVDQGQSTARV